MRAINFLKAMLISTIVVCGVSACGGSNDEPTSGSVKPTPSSSTTPSSPTIQKDMSINGGTPSDVTKALETMLGSITGSSSETFTLNIDGTIDVGASNNTITVPQVNGSFVVINFKNAPKGTSASSPLNIVAKGQESKAVGSSVNTMTVSMAGGSNTYLNVDTPTTTVMLKGVFEKVTSRTANATLRLIKDCIINQLVIHGGSVYINKNAKVSEIQRSSVNSDSVTELILEEYNNILGNADEIKLDKNYKITYSIPKVSEKEALMDLYYATNGDQWTDKEGWGTDEDLYNWARLAFNEKMKVRYIMLASNNLTGYIPASIGSLEDLEYIGLSENNLSGEIPETLFSLKKLEFLWLWGNKFNSTISREQFESAQWEDLLGVSWEPQQDGYDITCEDAIKELYISLEGIQWEDNAAKMKIGESVQIQVDISPSTAYNKEVYYLVFLPSTYGYICKFEGKNVRYLNGYNESDLPVIIDENGLLTAKKEGLYEIICWASDRGGANCLIKINITK